jgi:sugar lactone lactonase YvrE
MRKTLTLTLPMVALSLALAPVAATADPATQVIVLPGASSAEGITAGKGTTFYAGDLARGDIFAGDIRRGTAERIIDAPDGRPAVGMAADLRYDLLFVAGGGAGQAYVYNTRSRTAVASYDLGDPASTMINDVVVTPSGAWFTDSRAARLFFVPVVCGVPGPARTLQLTGPAAVVAGNLNLNGIEATPSGQTLVVAHSGVGKLFTVDSRTGTSAEIAGVDVPDADGLVLAGRQVWVVEGFANKVTEWRLSADMSSGTLVELITDPLFGIPTSAAKFGSRLALVNSHFDTGFPPTSPTFEVIVRSA